MRRSTIILIIFFVISFAVAVVSWFTRSDLRRDRGSYPVISMETRVIEVPVGADENVILEGIIANDAEDGDLTNKLILEEMSRFTSKGRRNAKIAVVDSSDNVTEESIEIVYTDYESPKFSLTAPLIFPVGTSNLDGVIEAKDMIDGDITGKIRLKSDASDLGDREGSYAVTFTCSNSLGDSSEIPLTITYGNSVADSSNPKITLTDYLVYIKQDTQTDPWAFVESLNADKLTYKQMWEDDRYVLKATDDDAKVLSANDFDIQYGGLNVSIPGVYEVFYTYTDSQNRTGRTCLVIVVEEAD